MFIPLRSSRPRRIALLLVLFTTLIPGCLDGPRTGQAIKGTPDGTVDRLVISEGVVMHESGKFLELVDRTDQTLVLVDFWADWCGPCKALAPSLEKIKKKWGDKLEVVKVDVDQNQPIQRHLEVTGIPDVRIYRNGVQVGGFVGLAPREEIESILKSLK